MVNPEPARGIARSVGSLAPETGRYQHSACTTSEILGKGDIFVLCTNPNCPNKGANWALQAAGISHHISDIPPDQNPPA
jgi:hypothetical protein